MEEYIRKPLRENIDEMFIGPFGSSLKNESFVEKKDAYCMVYEQKHAIQKTMNVETRYVTKEKYEELKRFNIKGGDIIVSCRGTIGETFVIPLNAPIGIMHPSIMKIRLKEDVYDRQYFNLLLIKYLREHEAEANGSGVKMAISAKELSEVYFPVPPIDIQKDIVSLFENVDNIISSRKQQLLKLDELVKSRFVEMFGGADYPTVLFENVCVFLRNGASIKQTKGAGGYPITRIETLSNDVFNIDRLGYADITDLEKYQSYVLHNGDILISHINSVTYLGRAVQYRGQLDTPIIHGMNLLCARIVDSYNPTYIEWFFKTPMAKEYISTITKKAVNQASITTSDLKKMQVPNPPKNLQDQFAAFVEQIDKSKLEIQNSLEKLETLKKALMQKYFG